MDGRMFESVGEQQGLKAEPNPREQIPDYKGGGLVLTKTGHTN